MSSKIGGSDGLYAELESLLADTIEGVADIKEQLRLYGPSIISIPEIRSMVNTVANAQQLMAQSADRMSETLKKTEDRYERMEIRHEALVALATSKEQLPLKSHYWTLFAALLPTVVMSIGIVVGVLYVTKYDLNASLNNIQLNQQKTQQLINETVKK